MFDDKLTRARRLIEQRDQIDHELRTLFGESSKPSRGRRRTDIGHHSDPPEQQNAVPVTSEI